MLTYILEVIFFLSAGLVLYLFITKLPVLEGMGEEDQSKRKMSVIQEKVAQLADKKFASGTMKLLRRLRLIILKIDNTIVRNLEKIKEKAEEQKQDQKAHILKEVEGSEKKDEEEKN